MTETKQVVALAVVNLETGEVVQTIQLHGNNPDKVTRGILRNMDTDLYCIREVEE